MKRLILMGGRPWQTKDAGRKFVHVLLRYAVKQANLAFCMFAQPERDWEETRKWNAGMIDRFAGKTAARYATMTAENFEQLSRWADIIYIPGGFSHGLRDKLQAYPTLAQLWEGKVVAGSSAGAAALCAQYVYLQDRTFGEGLGWVQASCIPHWRDNFEGYADEDWDLVEAELLKRRPDLPVLCIPEGQFMEISVK